MSDMPQGLHPDRLIVCFRTAGAAGLPGELTSDPRFSTRLSAVVHRHYDLADEDGESGTREDRILTDGSREQLEQLSGRAGIIFNAKAFVREIRGPVLAAMTERFGAEALESARHNVDLAGDRPRSADLDELAAAVERDGWACLAAWISGLPPQMSRRVQLKWANDHAVPATDDNAIIERGPEILRRLAATMDDVA
jgi:hypothetical protein